MTNDTAPKLEQFKAAPLSAALTQRLIQSAKAAQQEALLDRKTEETLQRFSPAPISAALQARLDSKLPNFSKESPYTRLLKAWTYSPYKQMFSRAAAILLFLGVSSLAVYSSINMSLHDPNSVTDTNHLAAGQQRDSIEHFAPVGYTKRDIISTKAGDEIQWEDNKAYQSYRVKYTNSLIVDLDEGTSVMISAPRERKVSVQIQTI